MTEAIVNAVTHRHYESNGSVQVMLFRDRLEVWNPGHLPFGLTVERLSHTHPSVPTNPLLANAVYLAGYIERLGTGTEDIVNDCLAAGLQQPEYVQTEDFRVIIWRNTEKTDKNTENTPWEYRLLADRLPKDCRKEVFDTLRLIVENPHILQKEIADRIHVSERSVGTYVSILKKYCIRRTGGKTSGYWIAKE